MSAMLSEFRFFKLLAFFITALCLVALPQQLQAEGKSKFSGTTADTPAKDRIVLMPLRLASDIQNLQGAMQTALVEGLQAKYTVLAGDVVAKKTNEIFHKESAKKICDEIRCLQDIAIAFQAELIAVADITRTGGGYLLALRISDVMSNEAVYSKSIPCKGCDEFQVVEMLKELTGVAVAVEATPKIEYSGSIFKIAPPPEKLKITAPTLLPPQVSKPIKDCDDCPEMVTIPSGSFNMGSPVSELGRFEDEGPLHRVNVKSFLMGKTHITRGEFATFVNETHYDAGDICFTFEEGIGKTRKERNWRNPGFPQLDNHPVTCINWNDAKAYADWLSGKTGKRYRLPSEAEWEYAARAGTTSPRYWGESPDLACTFGNVGDRSLMSQLTGFTGEKHNCNDRYVYTAPVASFKPNAFGLYDMQGNLWQWISDHYRTSYVGAPTDGSEWQSDLEKRVVRGGSWVDGPRVVRSAERLIPDAAYRNAGIGFRVARSLSPY